MRKKMIKNDMFYINYPYRPDMDNSVSGKYFVGAVVVLW